MDHHGWVRLGAPAQGLRTTATIFRVIVLALLVVSDRVEVGTDEVGVVEAGEVGERHDRAVAVCAALLDELVGAVVGDPTAKSGPRSGRQRYRGLVVSCEHLDELRRRLAKQTDQGATSDRVTTARLARMRRRLSELERISETTMNEAQAMSAEEEALEIMDSLENVRELRP